jgi:hypothetical protein
MVSSVPGRSNHPGGLSQLGYACFWPEGGGLTEGLIHPHHDPLVEPLPSHADNEHDGQTGPRLKEDAAVEGVGHQHTSTGRSSQELGDTS